MKDIAINEGAFSEAATSSDNSPSNYVLNEANGSTQVPRLASNRSSKMNELLGATHHHSPLNGTKEATKVTADKQLITSFIKQQVEKQLQHTTPGISPMSGLEEFTFGQLQLQEVLSIQRNFAEYGISVPELLYNASPAVLYEKALANEADSFISSTGALCCSSGSKTGRSPSDKRVVREATSEKDVWWGVVNIGVDEKAYLTNRERAIDYLNLQKQLYVVDGYAGWDLEYRVQIRVITTRAYHALFMQNMLVRPTGEELKSFQPDFLIYNAGAFPANRYTDGVTSQTSVSIHYGRGEMVILGTQYAGEMKKGVLTLMMYLMPKCGQLPLHSSCNVGSKGDVSLFFGLSGTGKTTLSADPTRRLVGDDEHVWTEKGVFNIEGGCYAKCKDLSEENEPEIFNAIRFGSVVENVKLDELTRVVDYGDVSITENTRCAYPLNFIDNALIPARIDAHPTNIVILTCDAFGVLPPVSLLNEAQAVYHFLSGFTSKMSGTEEGVLEPTGTFSTCFGAPFLALDPMVYAQMLHAKLTKHGSKVWLLNTGWVYGSYGSQTGKRIPLKYSRAILNAIHDGSLINGEFEEMALFGVSVPRSIESVPSEILMPVRSWANKDDYNKQLKKVASMFIKNFENFGNVTEDVLKGGPSLA